MPDAFSHLKSALADRYTLERELGSGGMATVYLAHDLRHNRKVAIKVMRAEVAAVIGAERFLKEIETTANLQHPNILPLFDSGRIDGTVFYVMPYLAGESLRDRLRRETQLPVGDAVRITTDVASALEYAHRHGVVHRDIKPDNVLFHDGRAMVADFGIARAGKPTDRTERITRTGTSLGTPQYMSPEQAAGESTIDARSDVYALGTVTYEMLAGEPPFTGSGAQAILTRIMTEEPRPVSALRKTVPRHIEAAVSRSLEKLPADRFQTAAELGAALGNESVSRYDGRSVRRSLTEVPANRLTVFLLIVSLAAIAWLALKGGAGRVLLMFGARRSPSGRWRVPDCTWHRCSASLSSCCGQPRNLAGTSW